jgi:CheY-like chemotaxis protein
LKDLYDEDRQYPDRSPALRILIFRGDASEADLIVTRLAEGGVPCELVYVDSAEALRASLQEGDIEVVITDHALPGFDGLKVAGEIGPDTTLMVASGARVDMESLDGAADVRTSRRESERLLPAVIRALRGADEDYRAMSCA